MPTSKADLLLHPIRLQIIIAISNQQMTAKEIAKIIPDAPQTTLYCHINALLDGGILHVASETQIRGTIERTYAMASIPSLRSDDLRGMTKQGYEQAFIVYLSTLMSVAHRYLDKKRDNENFNPIEGGVDLTIGQIQLSDEEFQTMNQKIVGIVMDYINNQSAAKRKPRLFTYLFIPQ